MDPHLIRLLARIAALELLVENVYVVSLLQNVDPVGEARRCAAEVTRMSREATETSAAGDATGEAAVSRAVIAGMAQEFSTIFTRILDRIERHARNHPTVGRA